jgi:hypothetical protein
MADLSSVQPDPPTATESLSGTDAGVTISRRAIRLGSLIVLVLVVVVGVGGFAIGRATKASSRPANPTGHRATRTTATAPSISTIPATAVSTPTTAPANRAVLPPATSQPVVAECSQQLEYGADGSFGPLTCANGTELNTLAWNAASANRPLIMSLGPDASPGQVNAALCTDLNNSTIPIETGAYHLAAMYYGWTFAYDPSSTLADGSCG